MSVFIKRNVSRISCFMFSGISGLFSNKYPKVEINRRSEEGAGQLITPPLSIQRFGRVSQAAAN